MTITGVMENGVMLGDELAIAGDDVALDEVRLSRIGTAGLWINGNNARVSNTSVTEKENMGVVVEGDGAVLDGISRLEIGTGGLDLRGRDNRVANSTFRALGLYGIGLRKGLTPAEGGDTLLVEMGWVDHEPVSRDLPPSVKRIFL